MRVGIGNSRSGRRIQDRLGGAAERVGSMVGTSSPPRRRRPLAIAGIALATAGAVAAAAFGIVSRVRRPAKKKQTGTKRPARRRTTARRKTTAAGTSSKRTAA